MFDTTITLFNRYHSRLGDVFYPHKIEGCQVRMDKASIRAKYGESSSDNAIVHIPVKNGCVGGLRVLQPKEWAGQVNEELANNITFNDGQYFDVIIVGETEFNEPVTDEDYRDGFYNYVNERFDNVFAVTGVAKYNAIPHYEIMAK